MKDLEVLLPMLREFLDERGLKGVEFTLHLDKVPQGVIYETFSESELNKISLSLCVSYLDKKKTIGKDTIILQSRIFNQ